MFIRFFLLNEADDGTGSSSSGSGSTSQVDGREQQKEDSQGDDGKEKTKKAGLDISSLPAEAQKLIKELRRESADSRVKNKSLEEGHGKLKQALVEAGLIEDDEESPEEKLKITSTHLHGSIVENAVLEAALEHGIGKEDYKYFKFLVSEKLSSLEDDQELSEDEVAEIAAEARGKKTPGTPATTSVGDKGKPDPKTSGEVTLDQFVGMNTGEKSALFGKNPDLYNQLFAEAKRKKILFK